MRRWPAIAVFGVASLSIVQAFAQDAFSQTAYDKALVTIDRDDFSPTAYRLLWCFNLQGMLEGVVTIYSRDAHLNATQVYRDSIFDELNKIGMTAESQLEVVKAMALITYG